jgi:nucleoside-specific outer membrane channel protein Tsx
MRNSFQTPQFINERKHRMNANRKPTQNLIRRLTLAALLLGPGVTAIAADWSDTAISWRYGTTFAEPFINQDVKKNILALTHASGYKYGTNFLNVDMLLSDKNDPSHFSNANEGAHEVYVVYRHTVDFGKIRGSDFKYGPIRGVGATVGFDTNTKTDVGYNSKKRMVVAGPTLMMDVPGFLNISLLALWESNQPSGKAFPPGGPVDYSVNRYDYDVHPMLTAAWGIPLGSLPLSFEGFANFIASKGDDEFGGKTAPETNIDMQVMWDLGVAMGSAKNTFRVGLEYQYWRNKFGNNHSGPAGDGAFAKTPMIRADYHF